MPVRGEKSSAYGRYGPQQALTLSGYECCLFTLECGVCCYMCTGPGGCLDEPQGYTPCDCTKLPCLPPISKNADNPSASTAMEM
ncbi:MAG: hypothetical protein MHM6MM_002836 [Cercozoa sp. M6MM]